MSGDPPPKPPEKNQDPTKKEVKVTGPPPTQVAAVDMLQLTLEQRARHPARACVIVSAWDRESESGLTPAGYIAENLTLLDQYTSSNSEWLETRVFGVSAQGGDFEAARDELAERDPLDRAFVHRGDGSPGAIGDPIAWALGLGD